MTDRGQVFTLEAFVSALLLLGAVIFALQAAAVTPQSASTASAHSVTQLEQVAAGVLDDAAADGTLKQTVLYWNSSDERFHGLEAHEDGYTNGNLPTAFGAHLRTAFAGDGVTYNVNVRYEDADGDYETIGVVDSGTPSDDAVTAVALVTLYDDDPLYAADETASAVNVSSGAFYAPDVAPSSGLYHVVSVEVVVWTT